MASFFFDSLRWYYHPRLAQPTFTAEYLFSYEWTFLQFNRPFDM